MKNKELKELRPVYLHEVRGSADDEISLVYLTAILVRRKILIVSIIAIFLAIGITKALLTPKQYTVSTSIEIGSQIIEGEVRHFDEPENLLAKLQHSYIPSTLNTYKQSNPGDTNNYIVRSSIPSGSKLILLEINGTEDETALLTTLQQNVIQKIIKDHSRIYGTVRQNLITQRDQNKAELAALDDNQADEKRLLSEKKLLLLGKIEIYELQLANLLNTRELSPPMRSINPTGTGKKLIVALTLFAGVLFAAFAAFFADFLNRVKEAE